MYARRRPRYSRAGNKPAGKRTVGFLFLVLILTAACGISLFLKKLSTQIAVSDAIDIVNAEVNGSVNEIIKSGDYGFDYFVELTKDSSDSITAIKSNMAHINALSADILDSVIRSTNNGTITTKIPIGNLLGLNLLMGKGPDIKVDILMLTSSRVDFKSIIRSAGINQSEYQLMLEISIDIDVLVPWGTESATTVTEVLIADTVIVGRVPDTYLNMENRNGSTTGN